MKTLLRRIILETLTLAQSRILLKRKVLLKVSAPSLELIILHVGIRQKTLRHRLHERLLVPWLLRRRRHLLQLTKVLHRHEVLLLWPWDLVVLRGHELILGPKSSLSEVFSELGLVVEIHGISIVELVRRDIKIVDGWLCEAADGVLVDLIESGSVGVEVERVRIFLRVEV